MALLLELANYLEDQSIGSRISGTAGNISRALIPHTPASCLILFDTPGEPSIRTFKHGSDAEIPRFQVLSRSTTYDKAMSGALRVYSALDGINADFSGVSALWIEALQPPFFLERDEEQRVTVAQNYRIIKRRS